MLKSLIDQAMNPAKYYWVINSVGQFEATEYLYLNHLDDLSTKELRKIEAVLLRSGKYIAIS